ncbi:MAG: nitroreductase family protein [Solirubrobacteraceae bacterium]
MDVSEAILTRRTHKAFARDPVPQQTLRELFELARWAPNHHLSNPWRFRVVGPLALDALKRAAGPDGASKLDRAPTLVAASAIRTPGDEVTESEDRLAAGCACYIVLLAAHARGLAGYWRTPEVLRTGAGAAAVGIPENSEHVVGLLHLGWPRQARQPPARARLDDVLEFLG